MKRVLLFFALAQIHPASAEKLPKLRFPNSISCDKASVTLIQTGPTLRYELTGAAAFSITVKGKEEVATAISAGNFANVESKRYYVSQTTGGIYFGLNDSKRTVLCKDHKFDGKSKGWAIKW